jgi:hypothetical protein
MTNTFQRIGNNYEKRKEEKKKINEKYWKLSSIERIDYDNHIKEIEKDNEVYLGFPFTKFILGVLILMILSITLVAFGTKMDFYKLIELLRPLSLEIGRLILILMTIDVFAFLVSLLTCENYKNKHINKLNKRFKLC